MAVALPTMNGLTHFGIFFAVVCSIFVTSKPPASMVLRVGRLHSQPTMNRLMPFMRSCLRASLGSAERTCSRKSRRPPGRSTRRISRSARGWSSTPQSTRVETATSKVSSSKGRSSAGARRTVASGAFVAHPALEAPQHRDLWLGDGQRLDGRAVEGQVGARPATDLEHSAGRLGEQRLPEGAQAGLLDLGHLAVVGGGEEPAPKTHGCLVSSC